MTKFRLTKGRKKHDYIIDLEDFELLDRFMFMWQPNKTFPSVKLRMEEQVDVYSKEIKARQWEAGRLLTNSQNSKDIVVYLDADSTNLSRSNLKLFAVGTPEYENLQQLLEKHGFNKRSFDKHPHPGVHWHMWTNKWAAYYHNHEYLVGLYETPEKAKLAIDMYHMWLNSNEEWY